MPAVATGLRTVELLRFLPESKRTAELFAALVPAAAASGLDVRDADTYRGGSDLLVLWGPGHPARFGPMLTQIGQGGHVLAWDLAYWDRFRKLRVSIDGAHPQAWVMRKNWPVSRFEADAVPRVSRWCPDGPILVAGIGEKATVQYGADAVARWEAAQVYACLRRWNRPVLYRQKRGNGVVPPGATLRNAGTIDEALNGVSLVITYHSNVAVDAILSGIPAVCADGAAAAICPSALPAFGDPQPVAPSLSRQFLANLAWFQWAPSEAAACWSWVGALLA